MTLVVPMEVTPQAGFFDTLGFPESLLHLPRFRSTAGVADTRFAAELDQFTLPEPSSEAFLRFSVGDAAKRLKHWINGYSLQVVDEEVADIPLGIHELHIPAVPDCRARLSVTSVTQGGAGIRVEVFGVGGGADYTLSFTVADALETETDCIRAVYRLPATWEVVEMRSTDLPPIRFARLKDIDRKCEKLDPEAIFDDPCRDTHVVPSSSALSKHFNLRLGSLMRAETTLEIEADREYAMKVGVSLKVLSSVAEVQLRGKRSFGTRMDYTLAPGHDYRAWREPNGLWWLWK